jgi:hypothetical protein
VTVAADTARVVGVELAAAERERRVMVQLDGAVATTRLGAEDIAGEERPGSWALVETGGLARVGGLRSRLHRLAALKGEYEFRTHKTSPDSAELYARFVGQ